MAYNNPHAVAALQPAIMTGSRPSGLDLPAGDGRCSLLSVWVLKTSLSRIPTDTSHRNGKAAQCLTSLSRRYSED